MKTKFSYHNIPMLIIAGMITLGVFILTLDFIETQEVYKRVIAWFLLWAAAFGLVKFIYRIVK